MEEKQPIKLSILTVLLIIAIIVIAIMGYFIYNLSTQNKSSEDEVKSLNDKISKLENSIENQEEKINTISNTIISNTENKNIVDNQTNTVKNSSDNNSSKTDSSSKSKYSKITKELEGDDLFLLTNAINNNDGTYTLKGKITEIDTSKEQLTEYPIRRETKEYRQITIPSNTKCLYLTDYGNELTTDTVKNVFSKKLYDKDGMGTSFKFNFKNGKYDGNTGKSKR